MKDLILQPSLPHQQKAVDAICNVFENVDIHSPQHAFENPSINFLDPTLKRNIADVQADNEIFTDYRVQKVDCAPLNLDIKMETGTGKTYVYTHTMYELHKRYGFNKFIIAVPSLAIKAGVAEFICDSYVKSHFKDVCRYDAELEVGVVEAAKRKAGKTFFPSVVSEFVKGSSQNTNKIYVLLVNMQMLKVSDNYMLSRKDYDFGAEGFYRPFDALKATRPVVIIDEPHRFARNQKAYKIILSELAPQCVIRFGATFPEVTARNSNGKLYDYENLLYDLNACKSFNLGLIKGVAKEHFEPVSKKEEKVKIGAIDNKDKSVRMQYIRRDGSKSFLIHQGESLSVITPDFNGINLDKVDKSRVTFSNGIEKSLGEEMDVDIYMESYQEQMIRLALQRHFETERANFCGRQFRIKTLALFFIDDISSYRKSDGKNAYLLDSFERILKEMLEEAIGKLTPEEGRYKEYLEASLADVSACHAGYFAKDNSSNDEDIENEVKVILHGKKQLLSFVNDDGTPNTLRFLFSKWTLKEGWDNPNVFTIAKLRSSGSEISKLQEVGRGLRLPVDEFGNRISGEDFKLNYIVDFTEADFAQKLVEQINGEELGTTKITREALDRVAKSLGKDTNELFFELGSKHYIDMEYNIIPENRDKFFAEYKMFANGLKRNKITDNNKKKSIPIHIRPLEYNKIKKLWLKINQRYILCFDRSIDNQLESVAEKFFESPDVFTSLTIHSKRTIVTSDGKSMSAEMSGGVEYAINKVSLPYGVFLKRLSDSTNINVATLHSALCKYAKKHGAPDSKYFNEQSISAFTEKFNTWKAENLQGRFRFFKSKVAVGDTALSYANGEPREEVVQGRIGTRIDEGTPCDSYLYDVIAYDSPLEKKNIETEISNVVVYGKIPRSSICIPTISGGTYSPDFMYVVKKNNGELELNIVVETKGVENKSDLRGEEKVKINCAKVFFENLSKEGYKVHFKTQINNRSMSQIIEEILKEK